MQGKESKGGSEERAKLCGWEGSKGGVEEGGREKIFYNRLTNKQIARHFVLFTECLYHPPSLLCNSNN